MIFIEIPTVHCLIVIKSDNTKAVYDLIDNKIEVSEQQVSLPDGHKITYPDGSMMIHAKDYALFRHWPMHGQIIDRIATRWTNLHL